MWSTDYKTKGKRQKAKGKSERQKSLGAARSSIFAFCNLPFAFCLLLCVFCLLLSGCRMDMQDQPRYVALRATQTFEDHSSARPLVEGTIARGWLRDDELLYTGKMTGGRAAAGQGTQPGTTGGATNSTMQTGAPNVQGGMVGPQPGASDVNVRGNVGAKVGPQQGEQGQPVAGTPQDANVFPFPVTQQVLQRGQERYNIYCSVCHGMTGYGDGMIVRRGFRRPPSYHDPRLRDAPVGHFFDVITNGWGAMPDYSSQIPVQDRWAIIAYIRALQLSQQVPVEQVPPAKLQQSQHIAQTAGGGEQH
jgi:mono/diheme cytochrome c family protein